MEALFNNPLFYCTVENPDAGKDSFDGKDSFGGRWWAGRLEPLTRYWTAVGSGTSSPLLSCPGP